MTRVILTGDVNLMNVDDPTVPFRRMRETFESADVVFSNLETCLYKPPGHSVNNEGFFADPDIGGKALAGAGIDAVGIANNVNYGDAAIRTSISYLDKYGIAHTGAGENLAAARAPVIIERDGVRVGFLQRSSVYWPTNHEARDDASGIAVIRGHTAYHVPYMKTRREMPPPNRPGVPPDIVTWADAAYLARFKEDVEALRPQVDILVSSCHWGLFGEVYQYMHEIGRAAIDAGADIVFGHGPHQILPVEIYKGRPIFYGLGSFSFHTGHGGHKHGDWVGMMADLEFAGRDLKNASFRFVRHNDANETFLCKVADETKDLAEITAASKKRGATLVPEGDAVRVV